MLSPHQNAAVVDWLLTHSSRPMKAAVLWATLFTRMRMDTGEICMSRAEMAKKLGEHPSNVSTIMTELEGIKAITRQRDGRRMRYFMNPNVPTSLNSKTRKACL